MDSESGKGSVFRFSIEAPCRDGDLDAPRELSGVQRVPVVDDNADNSRSSGTGSTILVAEDVDMNMLLIKSLLSRIVPNSRVLQASNGVEAVRIAGNEAVDLILMDV